MNELILALKTIKYECLKHPRCEGCPIYNENRGCLVKDLPCDWGISAIGDSLKGEEENG